MDNILIFETSHGTYTFRTSNSIEELNHIIPDFRWEDFTPKLPTAVAASKRGSSNRVPYIPPGVPGHQPKTAPFYGMLSNKVNLLPDNEIPRTREFRCTDCCSTTTLSISDIALNGDERVDLSCGCRVRLARVRDRAKAGKVI